MRSDRGILLAIVIAIFLPSEALAADLDGARMGLGWALPFAGMLFSIALFPLVAPHFWEHHQGKIALAWAGLALVSLVFSAGVSTTSHALVHTLLLEYIPFILLLLALFTVAGGIAVRGNLHGSPVVNTMLLAVGTLLASLIGTTGASMVMIRPVLRANDDRRRNVHIVVFFIFLVSNIGGSLTPLGDPPLFLGFLRGVDFFWTTTHLLPQTALVVGLLLTLFFVIDTFLYRKDGHSPPDPTPDDPLRVSGGVNFVLMGVIIGALLFSAMVNLGSVEVFGTTIELRNVVRDAVMLGVVFGSLAWTSSSDHDANGFSWAPMVEVAKLFAGIFVTIIPVIAMLNAGKSGAFAPLVSIVTHSDGTPNHAAYFWMTGLLSSFLDNAPTYLVFFELAGGDAKNLMTSGALTLAAISAGAVFMGANTYIGNAPNFMVYAIARKSGVKMPSFFGYLAWAVAFLLPIFAVVTLIFFL
ncbi:sodium:proton antiporter [Bradyrhizobium sp. 190]|uniref:sodium:proton antiporter n=1 Tax=Bradyrhizobium sp. 190 TaxID=2782658 RepID=UPI001FFB04E5|nr:sodium:proton antiporter [Bradyrhizobium sp. 190]MCK1512084.1 sodium:proton antiporter [Bradyrhizobium sp. 190]